MPASISSVARATVGSRSGLVGASTAIFFDRQRERLRLAGLLETRPREQPVERERRALGELPVAGLGLVLLVRPSRLQARAPVLHARRRSRPRRCRWPAGARSARSRRRPRRCRRAGSARTPGSRRRRRRTRCAEVLQRRLEGGDALPEAPAVVLEPARQVLRLGREARVRELRDHLAIAGDARRQGREVAGIGAALLVFASPLIGADGTSAYVDVAVAAIAFTLFQAAAVPFKPARSDSDWSAGGIRFRSQVHCRSGGPLCNWYGSMEIPSCPRRSSGRRLCKRSNIPVDD